MKLWQEMKQNCFLSPPACKPTQTYPQKKKKKKNTRKRKIGLPKIESTSQKSKVAKMEVATPSGLLWQIESWDHKPHKK